MTADRIDCDWRLYPRKPGWQSRAGGREHVLWRPDEPSFRVYASGNGWRISAHGVELLPEHRGKVWETAREAAMAVKGYVAEESTADAA